MLWRQPGTACDRTASYQLAAKTIFRLIGAAEWYRHLELVHVRVARRASCRAGGNEQLSKTYLFFHPSRLRSKAASKLWEIRSSKGTAATTEPFFEEGVTEAILPSLKWRAEGRARRPVLVRGGIIADETSLIEAKQ